MSLRKIGLLSLYGGISGGISSLLSSSLLNFFSPIPMFWLLLIPAICFTLTGVSIGFSFTHIAEHFTKIRYRLIICGFIGGAIFGSITGFGVVGGLIAPLFLSILLGIGTKELKVIMGAIIGAFLGAITTTIFIILIFLAEKSFLESSSFASTVGFLMLSLSLYSLNFGAIFTVRQKA